jgi:hypothetical protein
MDELTLVARLRQDLPAGIDLAGPERRLAAEISAATAAGGQAHTAREARMRETSRLGQIRGKRRHGGRVVVAALAAAAVAAAAAVYAVHSQPAPPGPVPAAGSQAGLIPVTGAPRPAATAAQLVAYATRAAAAAPAFDPKPHDWIYTKTLAATSSAGEGGLLFGPPDGKAVTQSWARVDGRELAYLQHGKLVVGPGAGEPGGWPDSGYRYLDSLPSRPAELTAVIEANLKAQHDVAGSGDIGVFNAIQALMENKVLPLRLRAALYAVLASDPAVHFDPRVTDFAGQAGVAFYTRQEGYLKVEIVINPRTYAYLGDRYVAYRARNLPAVISNGVPSGPYLHIRKGQVTGEEAVLQSGIVPRAGQVPRPSP